MLSCDFSSARSVDVSPSVSLRVATTSAAASAPLILSNVAACHMMNQERGCDDDEQVPIHPEAVLSLLYHKMYYLFRCSMLMCNP
jgi:hypothetical protein